MRGVSVDAERMTAQVNGGSLLGELDQAAQAFGAACPVGVVGHTGVAGLTLGGGMGRLQRRFGYTIDNLLSVDLVTAAGEQLHVSETEHPDLFWGMRGAGPNFGVVTSFEFRSARARPRRRERRDRVPRGSGARDRGSVPRVPRRRPRTRRRCRSPSRRRRTRPPFPPGIVGTAGRHRGRHALRARRRRRWSPSVRSATPRPLYDTFDVRPYLELQGSADEDMAWGKRFAMKGGFLAALSSGFVDIGLEQIAEAPGDRVLGRPLGAGRGDRARRRRRDGVHRAARRPSGWASRRRGTTRRWTSAHREWGKVTMDALTPFTAEGHYVNDVMETGDDVARGVYGDAKYDRLVQLKRTYDPDNVFRLNQNIRP